MSGRLVKASKILFFEDLHDVDRVQMFDQRIEQPESKFIKNFQRIKKRVHQRKLDMAVELIKHKLLQLRERFESGKQLTRIRSCKQYVDLKDYYPQLQHSISLSKADFDQLHRPFLKRLKNAVRLRNLAKQFLDQGQDVKRLTKGRSEQRRITQDIRRFSRNPHRIDQMIAKQSEMISVLEELSLFFRGFTIRNHTLKDLYAEFFKHNPACDLPLTLFSKYVKLLNFSYVKSRRFVRNDD